MSCEQERAEWVVLHASPSEVEVLAFDGGEFFRPLLVVELREYPYVWFLNASVHARPPYCYRVFLEWARVNRKKKVSPPSVVAVQSLNKS